jgi:hypothetical protein
MIVDMGASDGVRTEGRDYITADGDVVEFRHGNISGGKR